MTTYLNRYIETPTPQTEPLPGQAQNSAGGYAYPVSDETWLARFLILGSEGGSYYAGERQLTQENAQAVIRLLQSDTEKGLDLICEISKSGRAPRNTPALFALALAVTTAKNPQGGRRGKDCPKSPAPAATYWNSPPTPPPCAVGDAPSARPSPPGTKTGRWMTWSTRP